MFNRFARMVSAVTLITFLSGCAATEDGRKTQAQGTAIGAAGGAALGVGRIKPFLPAAVLVLDAADADYELLALGHLDPGQPLLGQQHGVEIVEQRFEQFAELLVAHLDAPNMGMLAEVHSFRKRKPLTCRRSSTPQRTIMTRPRR